MPSDIDPREAARAAHGIGDVAAHALLLGGALAAAVLRVASYAGPPRPFRVVALDVTVQAGAALGVGEVALGSGAGPHLALGLAILTGVVGWEVVKQFAARRLRKEG